MKRLLYAGLSAAALLLGTAVLVAAPASASTSGYCPTSKGVTVVADFTALGGSVEIRCDPTATSSSTGLDALHGAGFSTDGTSTDGPAFVCRINNQPSSDPCIQTPPTSAYWSYWYATNGGGWTYSSLGATGHHVIVGGLEGWRFYKSSVDGKSTPAPHASTTRPAPVVKPTFHMGPAASATAKHSTSKTASPTSKATTKKTPTPTPTPTATSATPGLVVAAPDGTSTSSDPPQAAGKESPADPGGGASPWPFLIGVVVVAAVGGGAWLVVYQRRQAGGG